MARGQWLWVLVVGALCLAGSAAGSDGDLLAQEAMLLQRGCTRCHDLTRVFGSERARQDWPAVVREMAGKPGAELDEEDVRRLEALHVERQRELFGENLFASRCSRCHELSKALEGVKAEPQRWAQLVNFMRGRAAGWLTEEEATFLVQWHREQQAGGAAGKP